MAPIDVVLTDGRHILLLDVEASGRDIYIIFVDKSTNDIQWERITASDVSTTCTLGVSASS